MENKNRNSLNGDELNDVSGGYITQGKNGNYFVHDDKTGDIIGKDNYHIKHGYTNRNKAAIFDVEQNNKYRDPHSDDYLSKVR